MNASVLLLAAAILTPLGFATYYIDAAGEESAEDAAIEASAPIASPNLVVRIRHDGDDVDARLEVTGQEAQELVLREGETIVELVADPLAASDVDLAFASKHPLDLLGLFGAALSGSATASFEECDVVEVLYQTFADTSARNEAGIIAWGAECVPGPMRHVALERSGTAIVAPYPTCPLSCTVGYGFGGSPRMEFSVPEGATRISVHARWDAESPFTDELAIWLTTPNEECGDGCWIAVETSVGRGEVSFVHEAPEPGEYGVSSFFTMPAGAAVDQDVWLQAVVEMS